MSVFSIEVLPAFLSTFTDKLTACKLVFIAPEIGTRSLSNHIKVLRGEALKNTVLPELRRVVLLGNVGAGNTGLDMQSYETFTSKGQSVSMDDSVLKRAESSVNPEDVLNLQFTSGMTSQTTSTLDLPF